MKKLALFAMLLCSCFIVGCNKKAETKPGDKDKPAAGAADTKDTPPAAGAEGEKK